MVCVSGGGGTYRQPLSHPLDTNADGVPIFSIFRAFPFPTRHCKVVVAFTI